MPGVASALALSLTPFALTSGVAAARESSTTMPIAHAAPAVPTAPTTDGGASLPGPASPSAVLSDIAPPPSAAAIYLRTTLHVHDEVALCADALNRAVRRDAHYDRLLQLDRYQLHATLRRHDAVFSIGKPVPVDTVVTMRASARVRGHWQWQPVITRCGLRHGRVVASSIAPRRSASKPSAKQRPRPGANYVGTGSPAAHLS